MVTGAFARHAVLSAHLDDAVLSASLAVAAADRVVTVFAGAPAPGTALGEWDLLTGATDARARVLERFDEDSAALAVLSTSVRAVRLDEPDLQHRRAGSPVLDLIAGQLVKALAGVDGLYLPAAIGGHPDHVSTRRAGVAAAQALDIPVTLYADVPYSVPYGWPQEIGGDQDPACLKRSDLWNAAFVETGLDPRKWSIDVRRLSPTEVSAKTLALLAYPTQMPALDAGAARQVTRSDVLKLEVLWKWIGQEDVSIVDAGIAVTGSC